MSLFDAMDIAGTSLSAQTVRLNAIASNMANANTALSGTIIGFAQALGETAPLILIGMVAFVVDIPSSPVDPSSSLPVQVYLWSESAERGFVEKTSATIMMLLTFLIVMNFVAVYLRQKFEKRWN